MERRLNGARSLQSLYAMTPRATSLKSRAVLRNFRSATLYGLLGQEFRDEFATKAEYEARHIGRKQKRPRKRKRKSYIERLYSRQKQQM
ncbi:hypothetical protein B0H19DRAFT_1160007 [Mycena capillaripes]|nr:hypothetical protein B0H19DRAFT_1160007 [Mycena capillaripes]